MARFVEAGIRDQCACGLWLELSGPILNLGNFES